MADTRKVYVGEIAKRIKVDVRVALDNLSSAYLHVEKPDGTDPATWNASVLGNPSDGFIFYDTVDGDLNISGIYRLYAELRFADGRKFFGERTFFNVFDPSEG